MIEEKENVTGDEITGGNAVESGAPRRDFLKNLAFVGGAVAAGVLPSFLSGCAARKHAPLAKDFSYFEADPENAIYSVCLNCHTSCPIKCKLVRFPDGSAVVGKIDGNPFAPQTQIENLPYTSSLQAAIRQEGKICPKGQAGIQVQYDPYRIRRVLKRTGARGENKWVSISFDQAVEEIVNGKNLPEGCPSVALRDTYAARDKTDFEEMKQVSDAYLDAFKESGYSLRFRDFIESASDALKALWRKHESRFIDKDHPDLGPKNNGFVFMAGRIQHGRKELMKRFTQGAFGSLNIFEHTTICEQSHHIAFEQCTNRYIDGKFKKGKTHFKPDLYDPEFVIFFGTGCFEANFGPPFLSGLYSDARQRGGFKSVVVDPRRSATAKQADEWIPIKPGGDGALAMGMMNVIVNENLYNETYLRNPNINTAKKFYKGNKSYTWATLLVEMDKNGKGKKYVRWSDVLAARGQTPSESDEHLFVVAVPGLGGVELKPLSADPDGKETDPAFDSQPLLRLNSPITIGDKKAATSFDLFVSRINENGLEKYSEVSGVSVSDIRRLAREFAAAAPRCSAEFYRGPVQHTNGYYQAQAIVILNILMGNCNVRGGWTQGGSHWHEFGEKDLNIFLAQDKEFPGAVTPFGAYCNRELSHYNKFSLYSEKNGEWERAERPWYPLTNNLYQEIIPSACHRWKDQGREKTGYPYGITHLFLHKGTPAYSTPGGHVFIDMLRDTEKIPVFIACDIVIGETSMYADYIIPDTAIWERWGSPHPTPAILTQHSVIRQPVVAPLTETVKIDGVEMPLSMEAFFIAVAKSLRLPGFGDNAFNPPAPKKGPHPEVPESALAAIDHGLHHLEDWYIKSILNIVVGDYSKDAKGAHEGLCPAADKGEIEIFIKSRRHLPDHVFNAERWKKKVGDFLWPHFVYIMNRGGRFEDTSVWFNPDTGDHADTGPGYYPGEYAHYEENRIDRKYKGNLVAHQYHYPLRLFCEPTAKAIDSMVPGKHFDGLPVLEPPMDASDKPIIGLFGNGYDLSAITYKSILGGHSRTMPPAPWLKELINENHLLIHPDDAAARGIPDGSLAAVSSPSLPDGVFSIHDGTNRKIEMKIKVRVTTDIAPGTVAISHHFGHWAYGSNDVEVDGHVIKGDGNRTSGISPNPLFLLDTFLKDVCLSDKIGGSASFYDTKVSVKPA